MAWLETDAVDMTGEPESFVELSEGRRLMVLRQREGACQLLGADNRCGAYAARPRDCRAFPFDFDEPPHRSGPRRLALLPLDGCDYAVDGHNDARTIEAEDRARWSELHDYQSVVARWNRRARHRRRLHYAIGDGASFLSFALQATEALLPHGR